MADGAARSAPQKRGRPDWAPRFLEVYRQTGNVRLSATTAGIDRDAVYRRRQRHERFAAAMASVRDDAIDTLEAEARRRALAQSDTLLIFLLKSLRPDVYRENLRIDVRREAEALAATMEGVTAEELIAEAERILRGRRLTTYWRIDANDLRHVLVLGGLAARARRKLTAELGSLPARPHPIPDLTSEPVDVIAMP